MQQKNSKVIEIRSGKGFSEKNLRTELFREDFNVDKSKPEEKDCEVYSRKTQPRNRREEIAEQLIGYYLVKILRGTLVAGS